MKGRNLERFLFLKYVVAGKCMAWKNILDMRRAIDYLSSRAEVKSDAIGCYGHSMGSTHTWLVGPWEPRLKALVGNCCLPTYRGIHGKQLLHCFPNFIPAIHQYGDTPFVVGAYRRATEVDAPLRLLYLSGLIGLVFLLISLFCVIWLSLRVSLPIQRVCTSVIPCRM